MCRELLKGWALPRHMTVGGRNVAIRADFRAILRVFEALNDENLPLFARWRKALRLFYCSPIAQEDRQEAMERLNEFINCYQDPDPGPRLMDWGHDAQLIAAEINKVAGFEVRQQDFVHWWTFLGLFHAIGPGPFAQVVAIRQKLAQGKKLSDQERRFYNANRARIKLPEGDGVRREKEYLEELLKGGGYGTDS